MRAQLQTSVGRWSVCKITFLDTGKHHTWLLKKMTLVQIHANIRRKATECC